VHSIATDSKGNLYTTETYEGKRVQKFVYKGIGAVRRGSRACCGRVRNDILMRRARGAFAALRYFLGGRGLLQGFPSKPVHIVVPFPPGGGADTLARIMEPKLAGIWAQPIVVENRPGASGHIGADFVAKSVPDGLYAPHELDRVAHGKERQPVRAGVARFGFGLCRHREPGRRGGEHPGADRAREGEPGEAQLRFFGHGRRLASLGGAFQGDGGRWICSMCRTRAPGRRSPTCSPAREPDVRAVADVMPYVHAGKLRALAVTGSKRSGTLPDLPTVGESGLPHYEAVGWFGLLAPAATPEGDGGEALRRSESRTRDERRARENARPRSRSRGHTPEEFARFIRDDQAKWSKLMKRPGSRRSRVR